MIPKGDHMTESVPEENFSNSHFIKNSYLGFFILESSQISSDLFSVYELLANPFEINYLSSRTLGLSVTWYFLSTDMFSPKKKLYLQ